MAPRTNLNVSLTTELCDLVADEVKSNRFRSASEVVRAGLRMLQQSRPPALPHEKGLVPADGEETQPTSPLELRYRAMLESALEYGIIAFNRDHRVVEWNAGVGAIMGWTEAEKLGSDGSMTFTPEDLLPVSQRWRYSERIRTDEASNERWHMRADGSRFWSSGLMMPIHDADGARVGHLKIMQDRTDAHLNRT